MGKKKARLARQQAQALNNASVAPESQGHGTVQVTTSGHDANFYPTTQPFANTGGWPAQQSYVNPGAGYQPLSAPYGLQQYQVPYTYAHQYSNAQAWPQYAPQYDQFPVQQYQAPFQNHLPQANAPAAPWHNQPTFNNGAYPLQQNRSFSSFLPSYEPQTGTSPISPTPRSRNDRPWRSQNREATHDTQAPTPDPVRDPLVLRGPVPSPSPSYTQHASNTQVQRLMSPQRLLLILDLNGVLIFRPSGKGKPQSFRMRPGLQDFLEYCFTNHRVMVWTSTRKANADAIVAKLFSPEQRQSLLAIWTREDFRLSQADFNARTQVFKRLSWVWEHSVLNPAEAWDASNTLLLDDSVLKAAAEPWNLAHVPEWEGKDLQDAHLLRVVQKVERLAMTNDVAAAQWTEAQGDKDGGGVSLMATSRT